MGNTETEHPMSVLPLPLSLSPAHSLALKVAFYTILSVLTTCAISDESLIEGFHRTDFSNPNLLAAAKGLSPSKLRFGGSGNDALVYGLSEGSVECAHIVATDCGYTTPGCLNASHWDVRKLLLKKQYVCSPPPPKKKPLM